MSAPRRRSASSSSSLNDSGAGTCLGTAIRLPLRRSPSWDPAPVVRNGWFSVARTVLPEASVRRKTGLVPVEKTASGGG